jgi:uncharacterized membrane protein YhfC
LLIPAFVVEIVVMLVAPLVLGLFLWRRWRLPWILFVAGAATFIASQVVHLPLNYGLTALFRIEGVPTPPEAWQLPFNAAVLGLTAGLCEEIARYLAYRFWIKDARTWRGALFFGAGHGGIESMLTGLLVGVTLLSMAAMRGLDPSSLGLPADQAAEVARQVEAFWAMSAYTPLLAAAERLMAMLFHLSAAALVMQALLRDRLWPLWAAIGWHTLFNAVAVYVNGTWGAEAAEAAMAVLSVGSAAILWATRRAESRIAETLKG